MRAVHWPLPCLLVAAVAAPPGLLGNVETDVVIGMVGGVETLRAQDAALVEAAIPAKRSSTMRRDEKRTYLHLKQLSPLTMVRLHTLPGYGGSEMPALEKLDATWAWWRVWLDGRVAEAPGRKRAAFGPQKAS